MQLAAEVEQEVVNTDESGRKMLHRGDTKGND